MKVAREYHGMSKDKRYWRWITIHNRCYNKQNVAYSSYGAKGVGVDQVWHKDNPEGMYNFLEWLDNKLKEQNNPQKYTVTLDDRTKNYGPTNCSVSTQQAAVQRRAMNCYYAEQVVAMRRYKRADPDATLEDMVAVFGGTVSSLSRALMGVTYSNVDAIEPPIHDSKKTRPKKTIKPKPLPNSSIFALAAECSSFGD